MKTTLSEKIATLRRQHGMTLEELGNKVGVGKSTVRKWETGMITSIRSDKLTALADTLEVDVAELLSPATDAPATIALTIGQNLQRQRKMLGYCAEYVAGKLGVAPSTVYRWEGGSAGMPAEQLPMLAQLLCTTPDALLAAQDAQEPLPPPPGRMHIGVNILRRRKELGMTQAELAEKLGCQKAAISKIELGAVDVAVSKLPAFAAALETGVRELLDWMIRGEGEKG